MELMISTEGTGSIGFTMILEDCANRLEETSPMSVLYSLVSEKRLQQLLLADRHFWN